MAEGKESRKAPDGVKVLLAHADRLWKAEEANATRLAARANLVLSGISAVLGLKLFALGKEIDTVLLAAPGWRVVLFWQLAGASLVALLISLVIILGVTFWTDPDKARVASETLNLDSDLLEDLESHTENKLSKLIFTATYDAATDLQDRNLERKRDIDRAQKLFLLATLLLFGSMIMYTSLRHDERKREPGVSALEKAVKP